MAHQLDIILVPHTHWDREWYQTFQQFRMRLVRAVDKLLDMLDHDPDFTYFMLDGQTIILDDYLEIQPEQEERLKHYTSQGRVLVGPWYVQPDEFLVSGESLIRNLLCGLQRAAEFGEPMRIGYVPDCFGHIAQLPQILAGFGIDNAVFWRGVGAEARRSEFYWAAPDGARVLAIHLADPIGYSNARVMPLTPKEFAIRTEMLAAPLLPKATTSTLLFMNGSDHLEPQEGLPQAIAAANTLLSSISPEHEKLLAQYHHLSNEHSRPYESIHVRIGTLPQYVEIIRQQHSDSTALEPLQTLSGEMRSSQLCHLLPSVLSTRMWIKQQNAATEHMLEQGVEPLTAWAWRLGFPYPKGLVSAAWKYLLQNHPHDSICGCSIDQVHRENAVRFSQSQQIAQGVIAQAMRDLTSIVDTRAPFPLSHSSYQPIPIVVFNPGPGPRTADIQASFSFPGSLHNAVLLDERGQHMPLSIINRWRQDIGSMPFARETLLASLALAGIAAPGELIKMAENMIASFIPSEEEYAISRMHIDPVKPNGVVQIQLLLTSRTRAIRLDRDVLAAEQQFYALLQREDIHTLEMFVSDQARETLAFVATDLPAHGLKTYWLYPHDPREGAQPPASTTLSASGRRIENEWYSVAVSADDGTLTITDKRSGAVFSGLNRFVDGGDTGDLYNYCPPAHDTLVSRAAEPPNIELVSAGPVRATLRVSQHWKLPTSCSSDRSARSSRPVSCQIVSDISLVAGLRRIEIHTSVDNNARDHRLRVLFPVPYNVESVAAEGTFEVRARPIAAPRPADVTVWSEEPVNTFPHKRFVDISNGALGLAVLNRGLPEYEILPQAYLQTLGANETEPPPQQMAVALTLLRCVEWLSRGDLSTRKGHAGPMEHTPEAQCLGHSAFDYALVPHSGDWQEEHALPLREAQSFNIPVHALVVDQHSGPLPTPTAPLTVEPPELVVSAIKRSQTGNGFVVRVYNPLPRAVEAILQLGIPVSKAFLVNLQEERQQTLPWLHEEETAAHSQPDRPALRVQIRAAGIFTLLFE